MSGAVEGDQDPAEAGLRTVVTLGVIVGGSLLVALGYWLVYLRHRQE